MAMLGHLLRALPEDPVRRCALEDGSIAPLLPEKKRVGRPRSHWTLLAMSMAWERLAPGRPGHLAVEFRQQDPAQLAWLWERAWQRSF